MSITLKTIPCAYCQTVFKPASRHQKFCSRACVADSIRTGALSIFGYRIIKIDGKPVREHRAILEKHLGRKLLPGEVVHHIDGIKANNAPENLQPLPAGYHSSLLSKAFRSETHKECTKCHQIKPRSLFQRNFDNRSDGKYVDPNVSRCKDCKRAQRRQRYIEHKK